MGITSNSSSVDFGEVGPLSARDHALDTMENVGELLARAPASPMTRALRRRAETYGRVMTSWRLIPPTETRIHAMLECLADLVEAIRRADTARSGLHRVDLPEVRVANRR